MVAMATDTPAQPHPLDNPIWSALHAQHRALAQAHGVAVRYPREVAPFLAVPHAEVEAGDALDVLVPPGDTVYGVGPAPRVPDGWTVKGPFVLSQMQHTTPQPEVPGPEILPLDETARADILELAALVYPHYFRPRTPELGRYFGIRLDGRLAAMIGERMAVGPWREVSAVCTHPDYTGRGLARRLLVALSNDLLARGEQPFLHVSRENPRAGELYLRNGYQERCAILHWGLERAAAG